MAAVCAVALFALLWPVQGGKVRAQRSYRFEDLEAAMLQKIVGFVRWPASAGLRRPQARFVVTVLGKSPLVPRLTFLFDEPNPGMPPARIRSVGRREDIGQTHVLFITRGYAQQLPHILDQVGDSPILVMGDTPGFAQRGVAVNLYRDGDQVRFEINRRALVTRRLQASYKLLALARLVEDMSEAGRVPRR